MATATVPPVRRLVGRGRQPAAVERLVDLADEVVALRAEGIRFATDVLAGTRRIALAAAAGSRHAAINEAERLGYLAERHLRQRGGAA